MANSSRVLATTGQTTAPAVRIPMPEVFRMTEGFLSKLEAEEEHPTRCCIRSDRSPTSLERTRLVEGRNRLAKALEPTEDATAIEAVIAQMITGFDKGRGMPPAQTKLLNAQFVKAVRIPDESVFYPLKAIVAAADRFGNGETLTAWDPEFRPNPAQFAAEVRAGVAVQRTKLLQIERILGARVYDPKKPLSEAEREDVVLRAIREAKLDADARGVIPENERLMAEARADRQREAARELERLRADAEKRDAEQAARAEEVRRIADGEERPNKTGTETET